MARDTLSLGPGPAMEDSVQVEPTGAYLEAMGAECQRWKKALEHRFPPVGNARFVVKSNPHEFGTYYDVHVVFDDQIEEEFEFAYHVE